jgi:anaerobic selenocysteine-containing dehydrogenase
MSELENPTIRAVNMVQMGQALTSAELDPPIRALIVYSSNPATIAPNQNLVRRGLAREDLFTVVHEQFVTDTAAYADYVLPATTQVEHLDLVTSWGHTYVSLNQPAIAPLGEAVSNTELLRRLARGLGFDDAYLYTSDEERIRAALTTDSPFLAGITFDRLQAEGWAPLNIPADWSLFAEGNFATPSGKCEFYAESASASGMDLLPAFTPPRRSREREQDFSGRCPLALITAKSALHFLNSSYANLPRQLKAEGEPRLDIHRLDAAPRNIAEGDMVRVFNDLGELTLRAQVGDLVRPGVAMPSGWWALLSLGGASANCLTSDGLSGLGDGGDFHDTLVEVECKAAMPEKKR